jgi:hypothetical protein
MERSNIAAARATFLGKMHDMKEADRARVYCLDETWVN